MNKLVDKRVRMNLAPYKRSPFMVEAFSKEAHEQGWSKTEIELAVNQTRDLSLDEKYEVLKNYCMTFGDDVPQVQEDVIFMIQFLGHSNHYLNFKSISSWDEYDFSNFNSLKRKATQSIKSVFAHYDRDVEEHEKYEEKYKPTRHFDTHEEALEAVPVGQETNINIYALWIREQ